MKILTLVIFSISSGLTLRISLVKLIYFVSFVISYFHQLIICLRLLKLYFSTLCNLILLYYIQILDKFVRLSILKNKIHTISRKPVKNVFFKLINKINSNSFVPWCIKLTVLYTLFLLKSSETPETNLIDKRNQSCFYGK